jgi:two-component system, LytTR family, sensor kinase
MNINKYHLYFWIAFFAFFMLLEYIQYREYFNLVRQLYIIIIDLSIFYSFLYALLHFKRDSTWAWVKSIALFALSFGLVMFLNYWRGKLAEYYGTVLHKSFGELLGDTIYTYSGLAFYSLGYYYLTRYGTKQKELKQLAEEKATQDIAAMQLATNNTQLQRDMLQMENNFLRAQINPHFLYNTLNVFYTQTLPLSPKLADSILTLSHIMRYSLETTHEGQLVPLKMEVAHLKRVIAIHQLRFNNQLQIKFTIEGPYAQVQVAPLIFITLLENALKHGVAEDPYNPIELWLAVDTTHIYFTIRNKKSGKARGQSHGIGMDNLKSRLQAVYGDKHQFGIEEKGDEYHVVLAITIVDSGELIVDNG